MKRYRIRGGIALGCGAMMLLMTACTGKGAAVTTEVTETSEEESAVEPTEVATEENQSVASKEAVTLSAKSVSGLPEGTWQGEVSFPDWRGVVDDTLALNSQYSFKFWHGQGELYVCPAPEVQAFTMYVNGNPVDTSAMAGGGTYAVDITPAALNGANTIQVTGIEPAEVAEAVKVYIPYPVVLEGSLEEAGLSESSLQLISDLIESDIAYGFPSAQLSVVKDGRLVYENAWGRTNSYHADGTPNTESPMVDTDTLYDLASVTKMFATNYALQKLVTEERISVDDHVVDYLGDRFADEAIEIAYAKGENPDLETQRQWKRSITLRNLLCHQAGFPADPQYHNQHFSAENQKYDAAAQNILYSGNGADEVTKTATVTAICKTPLMYAPGSKTIYSDVDYMILGLIVEQVTGQSLDAYLKQNIYQPMGLSHLTYRPLDHGFSPDDCAATEINGNTRDGHVSYPGVRTEAVQGEVHDEKAYYAMGGISGHAGLFSNATDLAVLGTVMLTGGYGENRFFSDNVMDTFTAPKSIEDANWGLGWWREAESQRVWYFGTQADSSVIGHQGWTGTLVMIDPEENLVVAYLTNKINSPVTNPASNANKFDGNWYTAATLGFVPQILYMGSDGTPVTEDQQLDLLCAMAQDAVKLAGDGGVAGTEHPLCKNARSKIALYLEYAKRYNREDHIQKAQAMSI